MKFVSDLPVYTSFKYTKIKVIPITITITGQNISWKDYDKYMRYIQSANTRYYGAKSPGSFRARSAHSARSESGRTSPSKTNKSVF